jgi:uncharacterized protein YutE (UPF0331/DUF86 family)
MYNVNKEKINEILTFVEESILAVFQELLKNAPTQGGVASFALARAFHLYIEAMTDIGNLLIDGFIMRDPGSYEDIVDIMQDENVYTSEQADAFKRIVSLRKSMITEYTLDITSELNLVLAENLTLMAQYPQIIKDYLQRELW